MTDKEQRRERTTSILFLFSFAGLVAAIIVYIVGFFMGLW